MINHAYGRACWPLLSQAHTHTHNRKTTLKSILIVTIIIRYESCSNMALGESTATRPQKMFHVYTVNREWFRFGHNVIVVGRGAIAVVENYIEYLV